MRVTKSKTPRPFDTLSPDVVAEVEGLLVPRDVKDKLLRGYADIHEAAERKVDNFMDERLRQAGIIAPKP